MALSMYNTSSYSSELVEGTSHLTIRLKIVDFVKDSDNESQFANRRYDSILFKILTSFFYSIELIAAMIMFSFVFYERSGAAGSYRSVINQLLAYAYGGVSHSKHNFRFFLFFFNYRGEFMESLCVASKLLEC